MLYLFTLWEVTVPRIRTLKPECMQHRKVGRLSHLTFRLWIGLITQADDEGRVVAELEQLRVLFFGYFPRVTTQHVKVARDELSESGLVTVYRVNEVDYAYLPSWRDHQRISHPSPSKLPSPFPSLNTPESSGTLRNVPQGSEGIKDQGRDRKGKEGSGEGNPGRLSVDPETAAAGKQVLIDILAGRLTREQGNLKLQRLGLTAP